MAKWIGTVCMILGAACLLAALSLVVYNRWEAENAGETAQSFLEEVQLAVEEKKAQTEKTQEKWAEETETATTPAEMATVKVEGYDCIGILSVPVLELELPVLADWSYAKLKKAPCLYYGSYYEKNFVLAAHNYTAHFGKLSKLRAGDLVIFTDVHGVARYYEVVLLETLPPTATEEMITSGFGLSLYTCTLGGGYRTTVRCDLKDTTK